jgi:hypothetical protein
MGVLKPLHVPSQAAGKPQKELLLLALMDDVPCAGNPECIAYSLWPSFGSSLEGLFHP